MEAIVFKAGAQIAGTEVIDTFGVHWTVVKNIANATAQPREGAYYTRVLVVIEPVPVEEIQYMDLHPDDFVLDEISGKIRIKR